MSAYNIEDRAAELLSRARGASVASSASVARWPAPIADDAYHGLAGEVVRVIEPHTESDTAALLGQFLAAFGNFVGRGPHYRVESDEHHANLFFVLVGDSSKARKGTSWGRIRALFEMLDDPWATHRVHSGLSSGEGLIWAVRDPIFGVEKQGKGSAAQYVECEVDSGVDDKRLMVVESEFANVLRVMGRDGNTLSRVIRDAWDKGNLAVMTKSSPAVATGAHLSIVGHITGDELRRYLDRTEAANGFANRFMYLCVRRARLLPHGGDLDESELNYLAQRLGAAIDAARQIGRVRMDADTREAWELVYPELSEGRPGLVGSITARGEAQVIRLATLYALIDGTDTMNLHHLKAALAIWRYAEDSAHHVFGDSRGDPLADALERALRDAGEDGMTRTAIRDHFKRHADVSRVDSALSLLREAGAACMERVQTAGRYAEVWFCTATEATKATEVVDSPPYGACTATEATKATEVVDSPPYGAACVPSVASVASVAPAVPKVRLSTGPKRHSDEGAARGDLVKRPRSKVSKSSAFAKIWENAWWAGGAEERDGLPYLSRSALKEKLRLDRRAERPDELAEYLAEAGVIEASDQGWLMVDQDHASALMISKNSR